MTNVIFYISNIVALSAGLATVILLIRRRTPKWVYTLYSSKSDGMVFLSSKDWDDLANLLECGHTIYALKAGDLGWPDPGYIHVFSNPDADLYDVVNEPGRGCWHVFRDIAKADCNMPEAVCW
jgi:hypothetical protein